MQSLSVEDVIAPVQLVFRLRNELIEEEKYNGISVKKRQIYKWNS